MNKPITLESWFIERWQHERPISVRIKDTPKTLGEVRPFNHNYFTIIARFNSGVIAYPAVVTDDYMIDGNITLIWAQALNAIEREYLKTKDKTE